ncbi:MAG: hypothetical protein KMY50_00465 [Candidatus Desulforudis sp.]|nr:hypothetical protein [Desulforudis sp.]
MTIAMTVVTKQGIVMGSESRTIEVERGMEENYGGDFKVVLDDNQKIHQLTDRIAICTSGYARVGDWWQSHEIDELKKMAQNGVKINELAKHYNGKVCQALEKHNLKPKFGFIIAGYEHKSYPCAVCYAHGKEDFKLGLTDPSTGSFQSGMHVIGRLEIVRKLLADETPDYNNLSIFEVAGFVELCITAGYKFQRYLVGHHEESAGPVKLLVMTPWYSLPTFPKLDTELNFLRNGISECINCGSPMRAVKQIKVDGEHLFYLAKCDCANSDVSVIGPNSPRVREADDMKVIELTLPEYTKKALEEHLLCRNEDQVR